MTRKVFVKPCLDHGFKGNAQGYVSVRRKESDRRTDRPGSNPKVLYHRWVFYMHHGYYPPVVMHLCDNPRCIELTHLAAGDWDLNNKDRARKGRSAKERKDLRRLTINDVREIRARFAVRKRKDPVNGPKALARQFGVDCNVIYQIAEGRTYRDVA